MLRSLLTGIRVYSAEGLKTDKHRSLCFSGHRENKLKLGINTEYGKELTIDTIRQILFRSIELSAEAGYRYYYSGLAAGFDLWAAEYVLRLKKNMTGADIHLIGVMPYLRHYEFHGEYTELLKYIERNADMLITTCENPKMEYGIRRTDTTSPDVYKLRNYYMVDSSGALVALYESNLRHSGTSQTRNYAVKQGIDIYEYSSCSAVGLIKSCGGDSSRISRVLKECVSMEQLFSSLQ